MSEKNCTTHHLACECIEAKRDAEIKGLIELLREALPYVVNFPHNPSISNVTALRAVRVMDKIEAAIEAHDKEDI